MPSRFLVAAAFGVMISTSFAAEKTFAEKTFAERLGWKRGSRVLILHCDDAGMSHESNLGILKAMTAGVATSASVMMPCPWVPEFVRLARRHPQLDIGLHLTLTAEWKDYRWGPVAGKPQVPGLSDREGCLPRRVEDVVRRATPEEVETEIRAQIDRAFLMGLRPTHLDSHMGTLYANEAFFRRFLKVAIEKKIPLFIAASFAEVVAEEKPARVRTVKEAIKQVWDAGLPVIDFHMSATGRWRGGDKESRYRAFLKKLKPGVTMVIIHPIEFTECFASISSSGPKRAEDLSVVTDPVFARLLTEEKIILTTWRELKLRRDRAGK